MSKLTFQDWTRLDDHSTQVLLRRLDQEQLAVSIEPCDDTLKEQIFRNMSVRAVKLLREDMAHRAPVAGDEATAQQLKIEAIMQELQEAGELVFQ